MPLLTVSNDGTNDSDIEISGTIPSQPLYLQLINFYFDNSHATDDVGSGVAVADEIKRLGVRVSFLDNIDCNSTSSHSTIDIPVYNQQRGRFTVNVQFLPSETIGKIINVKLYGDDDKILALNGNCWIDLHFSYMRNEIF